MSEQDFSKYDVGQGVILRGYFGNNVRMPDFGLIIGKHDGGVDLVPVERVIFEDMLCDCSDNPIYKDNVPLRTCPPPFSNDAFDSVYAVANAASVSFLSFSDFGRYSVCSSDVHAVLNPSDMKLVTDHVNVQSQLEFSRELPAVDSFEEVGNGFERF